jgi:hypothetical protein
MLTTGNLSNIVKCRYQRIICSNVSYATKLTNAQINAQINALLSHLIKDVDADAFIKQEADIGSITYLWSNYSFAQYSYYKMCSTLQKALLPLSQSEQQQYFAHLPSDVATAIQDDLQFIRDTDALYQETYKDAIAKTRAAQEHTTKLAELKTKYETLSTAFFATTEPNDVEFYTLASLRDEIDLLSSLQTESSASTLVTAPVKTVTESALLDSEQQGELNALRTRYDELRNAYFTDYVDDCNGYNNIVRLRRNITILSEQTNISATHLAKLTSLHKQYDAECIEYFTDTDSLYSDGSPIGDIYEVIIGVVTQLSSLLSAPAQAPAPAAPAAPAAAAAPAAVSASTAVAAVTVPAVVSATSAGGHGGAKSPPTASASTAVAAPLVSLQTLKEYEHQLKLQNITDRYTTVITSLESTMTANSAKFAEQLAQLAADNITLEKENARLSGL